MPVTMEWESRLGRRLRVRDLYILATAVKAGSMANAARQLSMSQPAVSEAIANLENVLGVRLLERSQKGIAPTIYADAMLKRSTIVFDQLIQGVRDIEFLTNPTVGEVRIGCLEALAAMMLPPVIERFSEKYPRVIVNVDHMSTLSLALPALRDRQYDLVLVRLLTPPADLPDDLHAECLYDDPLVVAAGQHNR